MKKAFQEIHSASFYLGNVSFAVKGVPAHEKAEKTPGSSWKLY